MHLLHQPSQATRLGDYLLDQLGRPWTHFRAAIAFVKRSGTRHVRQALRNFQRTGDAQVTVGIDHGGSSLEGLQDLLEALSPTGELVVFHNLLPLTFHPKVYLFKSPSAADLVIGSGNLTEGGLFANYEASVRLSLNLTRPGDTAFLNTVDGLLDKWADPSTGLAHRLDRPLLDWLLESGLVLPEASARGDGATANTSSGDLPTDLPFSALAERGAPRVSIPRRRESTGKTNIFRPPAPIQEPVSPLGAQGFLMTLQRTDVGVGQTTPGTSRRSPEIFIPLTARNANPDFWEWPNGFTSDATGKSDRHGVRMRLGTDTILVNMMTWPKKHDFRLRSEKLRSAGQVGDILRIEKVGPATDYDYYVEVVPRATSQYYLYLQLCRHPVRNSEKRYGYYWASAP